MVRKMKKKVLTKRIVAWFLTFVMVLTTVNLPRAVMEVKAEVAGEEKGVEERSTGEENTEEGTTEKGSTETTPCKHENKEKHDASNPTCTTSGNQPYEKCLDCGKYKYYDSSGWKDKKEKEKELDALGHVLQKTEEKKATCTTDGNSTYWFCSRCEKYFSDEGKTEIEKDSWIINASHKLTCTSAKKPTNKETGNIEYYQCSECDSYFSDKDGKNEIEKDYWVIPQKSITVNIGETVKIGQIMDGAQKIEKITLPNASKYKKYLTIDSKTGTIKTKKYYKQKIKSSIPVKVTTLAGEEYTVNVKIVIPAPRITVKRKLITINGIKGYKYTINYNVKGASKIKVRAISGSVSSNTKKQIDRLFDSRLKKSKGTMSFTIKKSLLKKKKIKFQVVAYYGKNQSEAAVIEK